MLKMENSMVLSSGAHQKGEMVEEKLKSQPSQLIKASYNK